MSGNVVTSIDVDKATEKTLNLVYENTSGILVKKSSTSEIVQEIIVNENITAPIEKGDVLGTVHFYLDDQLQDSVNLVAENSVSKLSVFSMYAYITEAWGNMLR